MKASNTNDELQQLRARLDALEIMERENNSSGQYHDDAGGDASSTVAVMNSNNRGESLEDNSGSGPGQSSSEQRLRQQQQQPGKSVGWIDTSDHATRQQQQPSLTPPPLRSVKFLGPPTSDQEAADNNDDDESTSSSSSSSSDSIAFQGWARVFFQARHHRSATQITSTATSTTSQDTYLHLSINSTANELRISNTNDTSKPPLIDPPIQLKYFYALKVPGSHSGAALFLKNDNRRLRKYIFRFEFINKAVHQPPQRYIQFIRSGNAAKKSMRGMNMKNMKYKVVGTLGGKEERKENLRENVKKAEDAFAAHLGTLDELLRESSEMADRFVDCVNSRVEEEELGRSGGGGMGGLDGGAAVRRTRPPPPYWGSGFNRPNTNQENDDDDVETDSDFSEEEEEMYDDDNDDETFFDKVQVSTEQTLETLFRHIVK